MEFIIAAFRIQVFQILIFHAFEVEYNAAHESQEIIFLNELNHFSLIV